MKNEDIIRANELILDLARNMDRQAEIITTLQTSIKTYQGFLLEQIRELRDKETMNNDPLEEDFKNPLDPEELAS